MNLKMIASVALDEFDLSGEDESVFLEDPVVFKSNDGDSPKKGKGSVKRTRKSSRKVFAGALDELNGMKTLTFTFKIDTAKFGKQYGLDIPDDSSDTGLGDKKKGDAKTEETDANDEIALDAGEIVHAQRIAPQVPNNQRMQCATALEDCRAANPLTCRYHGAKALQMDIQGRVAAALQAQGKQFNGQVHVQVLNSEENDRELNPNAHIEEDGNVATVQVSITVPEADMDTVTAAMRQFSEQPGVEMDTDNIAYGGGAANYGGDIHVDELNPDARAKYSRGEKSAAMEMIADALGDRATVEAQQEAWNQGEDNFYRTFGPMLSRENLESLEDTLGEGSQIVEGLRNATQSAGNEQPQARTEQSAQPVTGERNETVRSGAATSDIDGQLEQARRDRDAASHALESAQNKVNEAQEGVTFLENSMNAAPNDAIRNALENALGSARESLTSATNEMNEARNSLESSEGRISELEQQREAANRESEQRRAAEQELENSRANARRNRDFIQNMMNNAPDSLNSEYMDLLQRMLGGLNEVVQHLDNVSVNQEMRDRQEIEARNPQEHGAQNASTPAESAESTSSQPQAEQSRSGGSTVQNDNDGESDTDNWENMDSNTREYWEARRRADNGDIGDISDDQLEHAMSVLGENDPLFRDILEAYNLNHGTSINNGHDVLVNSGEAEPSEQRRGSSESASRESTTTRDTPTTSGVGTSNTQGGTVSPSTPAEHSAATVQAHEAEQERPAHPITESYTSDGDANHERATAAIDDNIKNPLVEEFNRAAAEKSRLIASLRERGVDVGDRSDAEAMRARRFSSYLGSLSHLVGRNGSRLEGKNRGQLLQEAQDWVRAAHDSDRTLSDGTVQRGNQTTKYKRAKDAARFIASKLGANASFDDETGNMSVEWTDNPSEVSVNFDYITGEAPARSENNAPQQPSSTDTDAPHPQAAQPQQAQERPSQQQPAFEAHTDAARRLNSAVQSVRSDRARNLLSRIRDRANNQGR